MISTVASPHPARSRPAFTLPRISAGAIAAGLIVASSVASLLYIWLWCPFDLAPDEAHYWDWSRHLDYSYYSKGPLVAWLIRGSCEFLGSLSVAVTGNLAAAVRTPAVLCHAAILAGWYVIAAGVFRSQRLGLIVIACGSLLPVMRAGAVLMTIDPPFLACWCWALVSVWKALDRERVAWWCAAAVFVCFGTLAKYTMLLFPAAVVGYLLFHRRSEFRKPGVWLFLSGAVLGWVPVLVWNARHEWVSFRHVLGQVGAGQSNGGGIRWDGAAGLLMGQFGMMFAFAMVAFLAAAVRFRPTRERDPGVRLLWWVSVPVWCVFAVTSFLKPGQPNWPAPAYIGGLVLAVAWTRERLDRPNARWVRLAVAFSVVSAVAVVVCLHFPGLVRPIVGELAGQPTEARPFPARRFDFTTRLWGWQELAATVDDCRTRVQATGEEPVIAGTHWTLPGQLGFWCHAHPDVYAIGIANGSDRHSQYDLWRPNPIANAQAFLGRTFVIVGDIGPEVIQAFKWCEPPIRVVHAGYGVPIAGWSVWVCHGFRGFALESRPSAGSRY